MDASQTRCYVRLAAWAALQLRRAAVSLGRGVVTHVGTLFSNQRK